LGNISRDRGEYEEARQLYQQSLEIRQRLGNQAGQADSLHQLGRIAQDRGEHEEARQLYQQSLEIKERLGDQVGQANLLIQLGLLDYEQGNFENALISMIPAYLLLDALQSPSRTLLQDLQSVITEGIRSQMDDAIFAAHWHTLAGGHPLPDLPIEGIQQSSLHEDKAIEAVSRHTPRRNNPGYFVG
jgi:tetratricopeptide (TPR) repeat protein